MPALDVGERKWVSISAPALSGSVTLARWLALSEPQLAHLQNGDRNASPCGQAVSLSISLYRTLSTE